MLRSSSQSPTGIPCSSLSRSRMLTGMPQGKPASASRPSTAALTITHDLAGAPPPTGRGADSAALRPRPRPGGRERGQRPRVSCHGDRVSLPRRDPRPLAERRPQDAQPALPRYSLHRVALRPHAGSLPETRRAARLRDRGGQHPEPSTGTAWRRGDRPGVRARELHDGVGGPGRPRRARDRPRHLHPRLRELLRVKLGLHFVPLLWLGEQLGALGYTDYVWSVPKGGFSYTSAVKGPALH